MKKILTLSIVLVATHLSFSQVYKSGLISSPETWSGTVYLSGNVTITSSVTIDAGTRVLFKGNRSIRLIVDGAGSITANGTSGSNIYFSADDNENGVYGETNERGLKIQFYPSSGSTGSSSFTYCIFEYIDCSNETGGAGYGALDIAGRTVTISNSILRNNKANYGGAVFVRSSATNFSLTNCTLENNRADDWGGALYFGGSTGTIDRCVIRNNTAVSGGGIYVYLSGPTIRNCLVYSNSVTGSGSGIMLNQAISSLTIINTTCANNTNSGSSRDLQFSGATGQLPKVLNSTIWGSNIGSLDASMITVVNSAIQGFSNASSHTSSISLSSNNTGDADSPYFADPSNNDWSLRFISPCRDAGANSYSGITIPSTDYLGNSTIHNKDIGAFEYQYSRWRTDAGSTDWATGANWHGGVPSSDRDIVIPAGAGNYPTGASAPNVTVGSDRYFVMDPGSRATINSLTNNGILHLRESSSQFSSIILNSYTRGTGGSERIEVHLSGGGTVDDDNFRWHYISSPVSSLAASVFSDITVDLAQYIESRPTFSILEGWVAFDGYIYSTGSMGGPTFSTLTTGSNGKGYNYWYNQDRLYTFGGLLNTSDVTAPLGFSGNASMHGFNLLGNPFKSGLDWDYIIEDVNYPSNTSKGLYFTRNNEQCSYIGGVGIPGDVTGIIPPMQGFFTKTYAASNSITLPASARTHDNIHPRYKGAGTIIPLVRLALEGSDKTDETVVRFDESAKPGLDNDFDALKLFINDYKTYLYTITEGVKYAINGQPFPEETVEIPVVINVRTTGSHTLSATQVQGLDDYRVRLKDLSQNTITDLKQHPDYQFSADKGVITDRFVLQVSYFALSNETIDYNESAIRIYPYAGNINIIPENELWSGKSVSIKLIDLSGRTLAGYSKIELQQGVITTIQAPTAKGVYFIEISSGLQKHTGKVMIR